MLEKKYTGKFIMFREKKYQKRLSQPLSSSSNNNVDNARLSPREIGTLRESIFCLNKDEGTQLRNTKLITGEHKKIKPKTSQQNKTVVKNKIVRVNEKSDVRPPPQELDIANMLTSPKWVKQSFQHVLNVADHNASDYNLNDEFLQSKPENSDYGLNEKLENRVSENNKSDKNENTTESSVKGFGTEITEKEKYSNKIQSALDGSVEKLNEELEKQVPKKDKSDKTSDTVETSTRDIEPEIVNEEKYSNKIQLEHEGGTKNSNEKFGKRVSENYMSNKTVDAVEKSAHDIELDVFNEEKYSNNVQSALDGSVEELNDEFENQEFENDKLKYKTHNRLEAIYVHENESDITDEEKYTYNDNEKIFKESFNSFERFLTEPHNLEFNINGLSENIGKFTALPEMLDLANKTFDSEFFETIEGVNRIKKTEPPLTSTIYKQKCDFRCIFGGKTFIENIQLLQLQCRRHFVQKRKTDRK